MHTNLFDVQAFDELYLEHHEALYRNIVKYTREPVAAKDILQDVFVQLWEKRNKINTGSSSSVTGLLFVISRHLCIDYSRKKLREETGRRLFFDTDEYSSDVCYNEEDAALLLEKAIQQLSPQKRRTLTLCKLQGKTYVEAAKELHISPHTVKEYLSNAIVALNDYMKEKII